VSARARVDAMRPQRPPPTRTAPPRMPDAFPTRGNYLAYVAFGACGFFLMTVGLLVLRTVWTLGHHDPAAWQALLTSYAHPLYVAFHALALVAMTWFALRFFRLFPKTQPPRIGPMRRPPDAFFAVALNGGFVLVSLVAVAILWGVFP
jgi:fumarate reductase subunit C